MSIEVVRPKDRTPLPDNIGVRTTQALRDRLLAYTQKQSDDDVEAHAAARQIPPPEIRATELSQSDPRIPGGAKQVIDAAAGWRLKVTYARGPVVHSTQETFLRMVDSVLVRGVLGTKHFSAVWLDNKFSVAYSDLNGPVAKIGANDLKARLKACSDESTASLTDTI
mgnify:CR=1 FL=1